VADEKYQATNSPILTMHKGINFIMVGRMNMDCLTGGIHIIILPVAIDIDARRIIGIIILACSQILINGAPELELHIVTNLNRTE